MYHYYATLIQIQVNTRTVGMLKDPINAHVREHSRTSENKLSKNCKTFIHRFDSDRRLQSFQQFTGSKFTRMLDLGGEFSQNTLVAILTAALSKT
jgi:hypothetical protein